jgi:hypothetical protein
VGALPMKQQVWAPRHVLCRSAVTDCCWQQGLPTSRVLLIRCAKASNAVDASSRLLPRGCQDRPQCYVSGCVL